MRINWNILATGVAVSMLSACISSDSATHNAEPSDDAAEQNYDLGTQYYRNGSYGLAQLRLERAVELDSKYADAYSLLALTQVQLGKHRLATDSFEKAVRLEPDNFNARNAFAVFLCQQRDFDGAKKQFDKAIDVRENDNAEVMMSNAGVCMVQKPDLVLAEEYFREALATRPTYGEPLIQLASLKHQIGDSLTARAFIQRYLAVNKASAGVLYLAVQVEVNLGDERAANDYKSQIFTDYPNSAEAKQLLMASQ